VGVAGEDTAGVDPVLVPGLCLKEGTRAAGPCGERSTKVRAVVLRLWLTIRPFLGTSQYYPSLHVLSFLALLSVLQAPLRSGLNADCITSNSRTPKKSVSWRKEPPGHPSVRSAGVRKTVVVIALQCRVASAPLALDTTTHGVLLLII